jgi:spore coat polysaccharide biosynthesis predicted glycosyltransferase SpsG
MHREISSFFMMKYSSLDLNKGYLGKAAKPFFVQSEKSLEIFGYHDLWAAEQILKRQKILFVVSGYPEIGMGHVFRALKLAQEMVHYEVCFLCDEKSDLAYEYIQEYRYPVWQQKENSLLEEITTINPDLVINDILNTSINYVLALKNQGYLVVNFEDVGEGASHADLVINALYDETEQKNSLAGEGYFVMRDEFLSLDYAIKEQLKNILLTFGGSDPNNQTLRVLKLLIENNAHNSVTITVVTGPGYNNEDSLKQYLESLDKEVRKQIEWICGGTKKLSVYMHEADLVFSSAGRTVFELAGVGVPAIILAVNERETKHAFAKKSGFKYLGLYSKVSDQKIVEAIESLKFLEVRKSMQAKVKAHNLHQGVEKIVGNIEKIIELKEVN